MTKSALFVLPFVVFACASEVPEEDSTSASSLSCPSPTEDREGFIACVKQKTSAGRTSRGSRGSSSGNGGTASSSQNGGNIQIGDINSGGNTGGGGRCSNLNITCRDNACTCSSSSVSERACNGSDCDEVCCP